MGLSELDEFMNGEYGAGKQPPIGWGIPVLGWNSCGCDDCNIMTSLSRPEAAFLLLRYQCDHNEEWARVVDVIRHTRGLL